MTKINILETPYETFLRVRTEEVCELYLGWSHEIMTGQVKPNRIIQNIAQKKNMSGAGVRSILIRCGIYKSAKQPLVVREHKSDNIPLPGGLSDGEVKVSL